MRPRKNFKSALFETQTDSESVEAPVNSARIPYITFPDNGTHTRNFDSKAFLGKGFDDIVLTTFSTIERLLDSAIDTGQQSRSYTTLVSYCVGGLTHLYDYCGFLIESKHFFSLSCLDITEDFIVDFAEFLQRKPITTQRHIFARVKAVLTEREFNVQSEWFPNRSFTKKDPSEPPRATYYTPQEHMALEQALSQEVRYILKGTGQLIPEQLSYCLVTLADKTGANLQPLLEIDTTSITEHPFHPQKRILNLYKRRGNKNQPIPLIPEEVEDGLDYVETSPFIEKLINTIISRNEVARKSSSYPSRVFVAPGNAKGGTSGKALTIQATREAIKNLIHKHSLKSENGKPLIVNFERIRKTWINNIYELTNYDPYTTAALANHGIKVSNDHYLQAPPDSKKKHSFMGEVRVQELLDKTYEKTIIASCSDPKNGERAPKNGSLCVQVFGCFNCANFLITADDLYRLYSFYFYCLRQRKKLGAKTWKKTYSLIARIITTEILPQFEKKTVNVALNKARSTPHPAWKN
jgi:hypothetical protein